MYTLITTELFVMEFRLEAEFEMSLQKSGFSDSLIHVIEYVGYVARLSMDCDLPLCY